MVEIESSVPASVVNIPWSVFQPRWRMSVSHSYEGLARVESSVRGWPAQTHLLVSTYRPRTGWRIAPSVAGAAAFTDYILDITTVRRVGAAGELGPRGQFRCTFAAKVYCVLWLIEHCYHDNAITKRRLLEHAMKTGRVANNQNISDTLIVYKVYGMGAQLHRLVRVLLIGWYSSLAYHYM